MNGSVSPATGERSSLRELFAVALRLGLTSFGGPIAHLGYYHAEYVERRRWLDERTFADLVALCQFLPGPASTQVTIGVGLLRAGYAGAFAAWLGTWAAASGRPISSTKNTMISSVPVTRLTASGSVA